jgi:hypothetical protein
MRHNRIMRLKVRALSEEELEADRDAAEMAGIDPETGKFISDDRSDTSDRTDSGASFISGPEGAGRHDQPGEKNDHRPDDVNSTGRNTLEANTFTEEDARAFAEGHAYSIRQNPGKHYSRAIHNSGSGNNSNVRKNGGNSGSSNGRKSSSNGSSGNVSNGRRNSHNNANGNTGKNSNGVRGGDGR